MADSRADQEIRDIKNVKLYNVSDFAESSSPAGRGRATLAERTSKMVENRCTVFLHNLDYLKKLDNINQNQLCAEKLEGLLSPPQLTGYRRVGHDIPYRTMALIASAYNLAVEDMCGQLFGEGDSAPELPNFDQYKKYIGTYEICYFDISKGLGRNRAITPDALQYGIMTIYSEATSINSTQYHVSALFSCTGTEKEIIRSCLSSEDLSHNAAFVRETYRKAAESDEENDRTKYLYTGGITLSDRMMELNLSQVKGSDVVHALAHNRASNSSDGKMYCGGLLSLMSVSRGQEHMPCIQSAILSRYGFDNLAKEEIAEKLYLEPPSFDIRQEISDIVFYMRTLFSSQDAQSALSLLSDEDKKFCLESFVEKKLTDVLRRNSLSHYKIPIVMDGEVYEMIKKERNLQNAMKRKERGNNDKQQ